MLLSPVSSRPSLDCPRLSKSPKIGHYRVHLDRFRGRERRRNAGVRFLNRVWSGHGSSLAAAGYLWRAAAWNPVSVGSRIPSHSSILIANSRIGRLVQMVRVGSCGKHHLGLHRGRRVAMKTMANTLMGRAASEDTDLTPHGPFPLDFG
jgi:hypothetical protein